MCEVPSHLLGTLFKIKHLFFCNLYIYLSITTDFLKVLYYFENLEFQEYLETERSTTSIKMYGDLYPREVVISVLTDSSIKTTFPEFGNQITTWRGSLVP
jgi:hypothetical protein